jgi:hypothetical protein
MFYRNKKKCSLVHVTQQIEFEWPWNMENASGNHAIDIIASDREG